MKSEKKPLKEYKGPIIAGILTFLIGLIISIQISTTGGSAQGALVPLAKVKSYEAELTKITQEKEEALEELSTLEAYVDKLEESKADEDGYIKSLVEENEKNKMMAGLVDVQGPGIVIEIEDPPAQGAAEDEISTITYNYELLLNLINKLKEAGAEAISINEERVVQTTEISLAGKHVNINGKATAPPYTIKAIGPADTMEAAITIRSGIVETMKGDYNLVVSIEKKDKIKIGRYNGVISFDYAKPVE